MKASRSIARHGAAAIFACILAVTAVSLAKSADAPLPPEALPVDATVATIEGKPVTAGEVRVAFQFLPQQYYYLPAEFLLETVLNQMIDVRLMADAARAEGIDAADIERQVVFYRERLLRQAYLKKRADAEITPEIIKQRYEKMLKEAVPEDEVRAHHILVKTEAEAKAIADELAKGGDFEAIAKAKSIDETSAKKGGDLGYFKKGKMVPEFAEAAFATAVGKVSAPVQTQYGWHLIQVDDRHPAPIPKFEEVVPQLRDELAAEVVDSATKAVRGDKKIEISKLDPYVVLGLPKPPAPPADETKDGAAPAAAPAEAPAASGDSKQSE
jgi:peptidyl-prolyl cis-trans isomerase C